MGKKKTVQLSRNDANYLKMRIVRLLVWSDYFAKMSRDHSYKPSLHTILRYNLEVIDLMNDFNDMFQKLEVGIKRKII